LPVDVLFELGHPVPPDAIGLRRVHHATDGIDGLLVDEELELDELALPPTCVLVVERSVPLAATRLALV